MMADLTRKAALLHAVKNSAGHHSDKLIELAETNPRRARLIIKSGIPSAWMHSKEYPPSAGFSNTYILKNLAFSKMRSSYFDKVKLDGSALKTRLDACKACPHLDKAPDTKIYHLGKRILRPDNDEICSLCGCFISEKVKKSHEKCPALMPGELALSRWGEVF